MNTLINFSNVGLVVLFIAVCVLIVYVLHLNKKLKNFLIGTSAKNLDDSIDNLNTSVKDLETFKLELEQYLKTVEKRLKKSVQSVNTVRFNPFKGTGSGGNQSFATAFLDENNDGVVISSIYSREHTSVFSKPVRNGVSEYELSEEEKQAIGQK
jgi:uncharacterized membrane protein YukC